MIGDGVPISTRERAVSTDVVNAQELSVRLISELARTNARYFETIAGAAPTAPLRSHLASGLTVQQSGGTSVIINSGMLAQQIPADPPDVPTPDALDSSYRVGLNLGSIDTGDPWDTTGSWWLLEARVERVTTLEEIRDIYNPTTGTFAPSSTKIDKRYEAQIEWRWVKDPVSFATQLPANAGGWAPLAGMWRPAVGGAITDSDVFNLSVQLEDLSQHTTDDGRAIRNDLRLYSNQGIGVDSSGFIHCFDAEARGLHVFAQTEDGQVTDFRDARIMEAGSAVALQTTDTWGYVYLAPLADRMPSGAYTNVHHRGAMIVSRTAPDYYGRNSGAITAPAPFVENIAAGQAVHVGCIRSVGATDWQWLNVSSNGVAACYRKQFNNNNFQLTTANNYQGPAGSPINLAVTGPGGTEDVPFGVAIKGYCQPTQITPGLAANAIEILFAMSGDSTIYNDHARMLMGTEQLNTEFFELHPRSSNLNLTITATGRNTTMGAVAIGAGTLGNEYEAGICGFRF
jgi:hypothetical protein